MYPVGAIAKLKTRNVIGKESALKYHFCICSKNRDYLYVCTRGFEGDFPITPEDCGKLDHPSHISLSAVFHVPDHEMRGSEHLCTVSQDYLKKLWYHVVDSRVLAERERGRILRGLKLHFGDEEPEP